MPNVAPERFEVKAVRLDASATDHGITLIKCPGPGCLVVTIGSRDRDDAPGDLVSYEKPSMAVNAKGQRAIVLGRVPVHMAEPIGQEARCRVIDPDGRLGDGAVLHAGSDVLEGVFCGRSELDTAATALNFYHVQYPSTNTATGSACPHQAQYQDYATAVADPDGIGFWMAQAFSEKGSFQMIAGEVHP